MEKTRSGLNAPPQIVQVNKTGIQFFLPVQRYRINAGQDEQTGCMKYLVICISLFVLSCSKDKTTTKNSKTSGQVDAVVIWSGMVEADGCDWYIKVDETTFYHPDVLAEDFKQHNLNVKISYEVTDKIFSCGWGATMPIIHVVSIDK